MSSSKQLRRAVRRRGADVLRFAARVVEGPLVPDSSLVWLFGAPRSGTTWIFGMLRTHPQIAGVPEPLIGAHLGPLVDDVAPGASGVAELVADREADRLDFVFSEHRRQVWEPLLGDLVRRQLLGRHSAMVESGGVVLVKEPHGSEACRLLHAVTPASRVLTLVRDPRDVLDSVLDIVESGWAGAGETPGTGPLPTEERRRLFERVGARYKLVHDELQTLTTALPPDRCHRLRYEDALDDPTAAVAEVVRWLHLDLDPAWLTATVAAFDREATPAERRGAGAFLRSATPGAWAERFTAAERAWAAEFFAPELRRFGYEA